MKIYEKILIAVLGVSIFIVAGGVACTYNPTSGVNWILAGVLGTLIFVEVGAIACSTSNNRIAKQKERQITP